MKSFFIIYFIVLLTNIFASDSHWEELIIEKILTSITNKKEINIYAPDKNLYIIIKSISRVHMTDDCKQADFILSYKEIKQVCNKPEIVFSYENYLSSKNAIGVFFWQKGRPTIRFSSKRLNYFGLHVHGELSKFVSSKK